MLKFLAGITPPPPTGNADGERVLDGLILSLRRSRRRLKQSGLLNGLPRPHFVRPRNDDICHAELVSASHSVILSRKKNLKAAPSLTLPPRRGKGFTLAEVFSPCRKVKFCFGFTLAEVLITLGIIGVVAAITMPVLINKINDTVYDNQRKVAQSKLSQAINMLHAKGVLLECSNTEDFVNNLKNELKILKVCSENELSSCFVEEFKQEGAKQASDNKTGSAIDLLRPHKLKRAGDDSSGLVQAEPTSYTTNSLELVLGKSHQQIELAGITTADGINIIIGYEPDCLSNVNSEIDSSLSGGMISEIRGNVPYNDERACVGAIIDANGFKKPNTIDKDILFYQALISTSLRDPDIAGEM